MRGPRRTQLASASITSLPTPWVGLFLLMISRILNGCHSCSTGAVLPPLHEPPQEPRRLPILRHPAGAQQCLWLYYVSICVVAKQILICVRVGCFSR